MNFSSSSVSTTIEVMNGGHMFPVPTPHQQHGYTLLIDMGFLSSPVLEDKHSDLLVVSLSISDDFKTRIFHLNCEHKNMTCMTIL